MKLIIATAAAAICLSGCGVHKVVTVPAKGVYHTAKFTGKAVVGTTKFVGKSVVATGKGVYYVGMVPVKITDKALDTTSKVLSITTQTVDLAGRMVTVTREIQATRLDAELKMLKGAKNVVSVFVDAVA